MLLKGWEATFSTHKVWFHIFYYNDDVAWAYVGTQAPFLAHLSSCTFFPSAPYTTTPPPQGHSKHSAIGGNQRCRSWGMGLRTPLKSELSFSWGSGELTLEGSEGGRGGWSAPQEKLSSDFSGILTSQPPWDLHLWCQCTHKLSMAPWGPLRYLCVVAIANFLGRYT